MLRSFQVELRYPSIGITHNYVAQVRAVCVETAIAAAKAEYADFFLRSVLVHRLAEVDEPAR